MGQILLLIVLLAGMASMYVAGANMILMSLRRKPGVPYMRHLFDSPYNIIARPADLTEAGHRSRTRVLWGFSGFVICVLLAWAIAAATGIFDELIGVVLPEIDEAEGMAA